MLYLQSTIPCESGVQPVLLFKIGRSDSTGCALVLNHPSPDGHVRAFDKVERIRDHLEASNRGEAVVFLHFARLLPFGDDLAAFASSACDNVRGYLKPP